MDAVGRPSARLILGVLQVHLDVFQGIVEDDGWMILVESIFIA